MFVGQGSKHISVFVRQGSINIYIYVCREGSKHIPVFVRQGSKNIHVLVRKGSNAFALPELQLNAPLTVTISQMDSCIFFEWLLFW